MNKIDERMALEEDISAMKYAALLRAEIAYLNARYYVRIQQKEYEIADVLDALISMYKQELDNVTRAITNSTRQVFTSPVAGNKRVFILER